MKIAIRDEKSIKRLKGYLLFYERIQQSSSQASATFQGDTLNGAPAMDTQKEDDPPRLGSAGKRRKVGRPRKSSLYGAGTLDCGTGPVSMTVIDDDSEHQERHNGGNTESGSDAKNRARVRRPRKKSTNASDPKNTNPRSNHAQGRNRL